MDNVAAKFEAIKNSTNNINMLNFKLNILASSGAKAMESGKESCHDILQVIRVDTANVRKSYNWGLVICLAHGHSQF